MNVAKITVSEGATLHLDNVFQDEDISMICCLLLLEKQLCVILLEGVIPLEEVNENDVASCTSP